MKKIIFQLTDEQQALLFPLVKKFCKANGGGILGQFVLGEDVKIKFVVCSFVSIDKSWQIQKAMGLEPGRVVTHKDIAKFERKQK
jgi:hypothetical protein